MSPLSLREELVWHLKVNIPSVSSLTYCQPSCSLNGLTYYGMLGSADTLRPTHRTQGLEPVGLLFWQCCLVNNGSEAGWKSHCCGGMGSYLLRVTSPLVPCQRLESFIISLQVFGLSWINFLEWHEVRVSMTQIFSCSSVCRLRCPQIAWLETGISVSFWTLLCLSELSVYPSKHHLV